MDWKDSLQVLKGTLPEGEVLQNDATADDSPRQKRELHVVLDKKGRKGKTATIVDGFELPDEEVAAIAAKLKQRLGTGGSVRGGEILVQGDKCVAVVEALRALGFKARRI